MKNSFNKYVAIKDPEYFMMRIYPYSKGMSKKNIIKQQEIGFVNINLVSKIPGKEYENDIEQIISENIDFIDSKIHNIAREHLNNIILKNLLIELNECYLSNKSEEKIKNKLNKYTFTLKIKEEILFPENNKMMEEKEWIEQYKQI